MRCRRQEADTRYPIPLEEQQAEEQPEPASSTRRAHTNCSCGTLKFISLVNIHVTFYVSYTLHCTYYPPDTCVRSWVPCSALHTRIHSIAVLLTNSFCSCSLLLLRLFFFLSYSSSRFPFSWTSMKCGASFHTIPAYELEQLCCQIENALGAVNSDWERFFCSDILVYGNDKWRLRSVAIFSAIARIVLRHNCIWTFGIKFLFLLCRDPKTGWTVDKFISENHRNWLRGVQPFSVHFCYTSCLWK